MEEKITENKQIILAGWRKWGMCVGVILIAVALLFFKQPGPDNTWIPMLTGEQWIWLSIRVIFLYLVGNVGASAFDKFFTNK